MKNLPANKAEARAARKRQRRIVTPVVVILLLGMAAFQVYVLHAAFAAAFSVACLAGYFIIKPKADRQYVRRHRD